MVPVCGLGVGDLPSGWHSRAAVAVTPVEIVAGAEKDVLDAGPAHRRLVVIVADRILVGQSLEEWRVPALHIVESHGRAAAVIGIGAAIGSDDERVKIILITHDPQLI